MRQLQSGGLIKIKKSKSTPHMQHTTAYQTCYKVGIKGSSKGGIWALLSLLLALGLCQIFVVCTQQQNTTALQDAAVWSLLVWCVARAGDVAASANWSFFLWPFVVIPVAA